MSHRAQSRCLFLILMGNKKFNNATYNININQSMEIITQPTLGKDNLTHLSQLLTAITGFGGLVVPLVKKDKV